MHTTIIMVRHAQHDSAGDVLVGRTSVHLNGVGRRTAERLAEVLAYRGVARIKSSPQLRAVQTAKPLSRLIGVPIAITPEFDEVDFGEWTNCRFDALDRRDDWQRWNCERTTSRPPGGESMGELRARVLRGLSHIAAVHAGQRVAIFTHAEPIRAALLHYRRMQLADFARVAVDIASLTTFEFGGAAGAAITQNERANAPMVPA